MRGEVHHKIDSQSTKIVEKNDAMLTWMCDWRKGWMEATL